jgi:hypothetical protein
MSVDMYEEFSYNFTIKVYITEISNLETIIVPYKVTNCQ